MFKKFFSFTKKRRSQKFVSEIIRYGMALLGFNVLLAFCFFFGVMAIGFLYQGFYVPTFYDAFFPLIVLFVFAGASAVVWFRYGQLLGERFSQYRAVAVIFTSLISIVGLIICVALFMLVAQILVSFAALFSVLALSFTTMTILVMIFQILVVLLGSVSR